MIILAIESSCDETAAAVVRDGRDVLSNVVNSQIEEHKRFGGVVPEVASRRHIENISACIDEAIADAEILLADIDAVAVTNTPGLVGALLVGVSAAKGLAFGLNIPLIPVNHIKAHICANYIEHRDLRPPFLALVASGGHSHIIKVSTYTEYEVIARTRDDAAGEAFDKVAKILGLGYPGGPIVDKLGREGNPNAFTFSQARVGEYNYSFSGLKTSFLYFLRDRLKENPHFMEENKNDLCASVQMAIVDSLCDKLLKASHDLRINEIAIAGGVSANSMLQDTLRILSQKQNWNLHIPSLQLSTDNAAMIGIVGYLKYIQNQFSDISSIPYTRQGKGNC